MVIKGIKEKFEEIKKIGFNENNSAFILCDCYRDYEDKFHLKNIIPLENKITSIEIDRENMLLTDLEGNVQVIFGDWEVNNTTIEYVNNKDLIIGGHIVDSENINKREYVLLEHYHLDDELKCKKTLYEIGNGKLKGFELLNDNVLLVEKEENKKDKAILYSIDKRDYISPEFTMIEQKGNNILKFTDIIYSSIEVEDNKLSSSIIGFITTNGKFHNGVYDELSNKEIECEFNNKNNFEEYNKLKEMIQGKLDQKALKEINKLTTKEFILKKLENRTKNNI